jgi:hypothetical protein
MRKKSRPRKLAEHVRPAGNPGEALPLLAPTHWRAVEHLRAAGNSRLGPLLEFGVPAICAYHAALDSFMNEELAQRIASRKGELQAVEQCRKLQDESFFKGKLDGFLAEFDITHQMDASILDDVAKFVALRGELHHHAPELMLLNQSPEEAIAVYEAAGYEPVDMGWVMLVAAPKVVLWCAHTVSDFYCEYHRARGRKHGSGMSGFVPREGVSAREAAKPSCGADLTPPPIERPRS